jgi:exopolysaccharide biosynthesis polyprenyl glycosylphosphotransferase
MTLSSIPRYKWILAAGDYVSIVLSFGLVMSFLPGRINDLNSTNILTYLLFGTVWILMMELNHLYTHEVVLNRVQQTVLLMKSAFVALLCVVLFDFFFRPESWMSSRTIVLTVVPTTLIILCFWRIGIFRLIWKHSSMKTKLSRRTMIVGSGDRTQRLAQRIRHKFDSDIELIGVMPYSTASLESSYFPDTDSDITDTKATDSFTDIKRKALDAIRDYEKQTSKSTPTIFSHSLKVNDNAVSAIDILKTTKETVRTQLRQVANDYQLNKLIIADDTLSVDELLDLTEECTNLGLSVDVASSAFPISAIGTIPSLNDEYPLIHLRGSRHNLGARFIKRTADVVLSSLGLIFLSPVFLALAIGVKFSSPGKIIYTSRRIGKDGKEFKFFKFRSMRPVTEISDADKLKEQYEQYIKEGKVVGKIINTDRVTAIGAFMRRTSLDELPQLWNVLMGDMSLVGPRPCLPHEFAMYSAWHKKRLLVTPGCTGLWQISDRKRVSFNDMVMLDYFYVENMSLWFDLEIILKTLPVMFKGKGDMG